jgi:hypothetical protein
VCLADLIGFGNRWCGFRLVSSDLRLSSLVMDDALVRWCLSIASICLSTIYNKLYDDKLFSAPVMEGRGRRTPSACAVLVVARWFKDIFIIFITFESFYAVVMII